MNKLCTKCNVEKSTIEFYKDKRRKDGLRSWCKQCQKEDNKSRESQYKSTRKNYRETNKQTVKYNKQSYYKKNKEQILAQNSVWRRTTFNGRLLAYKRSALKRGHEWELSDEQFKSFWQEDCFYCGDTIDTIGIDRIDSKKGYSINNIVSCCTHCNIMKMHYSREEFLNKIKQIYELQRNKGGFNHISLRGRL